MIKNQFRTGLGAAALCMCFLLAISGVLFTQTYADEHAAQCPNGPLAADLTGAAISGVTPAGSARFRDRGSNGLMVNLRSVNVAANTSLGVFIGDTQVGTIEVGRGRNGQLRLDSTTASIDEGATISIRNGSNTILTGTFACVAGGGNSNSNNTNTNSNSNTNVNTNTNVNSNTNANTNTNGNTNTNTNANSNSNSNRNSNTNRTTNRNRPSPTPSPGP